MKEFPMECQKWRMMMNKCCVCLSSHVSSCCATALFPQMFPPEAEITLVVVWIYVCNHNYWCARRKKIYFNVLKSSIVNWYEKLAPAHALICAQSYRRSKSIKTCLSYVLKYWDGEKYVCVYVCSFISFKFSRIFFNYVTSSSFFCCVYHSNSSLFISSSSSWIDFFIFRAFSKVFTMNSNQKLFLFYQLMRKSFRSWCRK